MALCPVGGTCEGNFAISSISGIGFDNLSKLNVEQPSQAFLNHRVRYDGKANGRNLYAYRSERTGCDGFFLVKEKKKDADMERNRKAPIFIRTLIDDKRQEIQTEWRSSSAFAL